MPPINSEAFFIRVKVEIHQEYKYSLSGRQNGFIKYPLPFQPLPG